MAYLEDNLQESVASYLDHLGVLWFHPANERKTTPQAGARLKRKGVKSGVPDVMIIEPSNGYVGLAIELKVQTDNGLKKNGEPKKKTGGKLSDNQKQWLLALEKKGWLSRVCYNFDEVEAVVTKYFKTKQ